MKKPLSIVLALLLLLVSSTAFAAASVTFEGGAEKFVFLPGSEYSDSDMFENFKGVLPGDVLTQEIRVENSTGKKVRIYMRAEGASEADAAFLSNLQLNVVSGDKEIFEAAASETAQLTENTLLGTFKKNGGTDLTVTLTVPAELGNDFMATSGVVPWTFVVEEVPEDKTPDTGDWFDLTLWANNIFDKYAVTSIGNDLSRVGINDGQVVRFYSRSVLDPRTVGLEARIRM